MKRYLSPEPLDVKAIAATSIVEVDRTSGNTPSFKKAILGFVGSIVFLYSAAFYLGAVI